MIFFKYKIIVLSLWLSIMHVLGTKEITVRKRSSSHVIKTFQEYNGDIIDCFDIYKQPSLAHPLLKNHQVQLNSKSLPKTTQARNFKNISIEDFHGSSKCPKGYVPVKRTSNNDLVMENLLKLSKSQGLTISTEPHYYDAIVQYKGKNHGAAGIINDWGLPNVTKGQLSSASIGIDDGQSSIIAGWMVYPNLFKDDKTRLFTYWSDLDHNFKCYCTVCSGFIQISSKLYPGTVIRSLSIYKGQQYATQVQIFQDLKTGNWWLQMHNELIGYWPKTLFTHLQDGGTVASWGGLVISNWNILSPPMGSGHKPDWNFEGKVAYIRKMKVNIDGKLYDPEDGIVYVTDVNCYGASFVLERKDYWGAYIIFGGPGLCI